MCSSVAPFSFFSMVHSFKLSAAKAFGVEEAIMLNNLIFWVKKNQTNGRHFNDGRTWTYNTLEAFTLQFEYWTLKQIRRILDNLEKSGVIVTGRYNKKGYDKTKWYALFSEDMTADDFDFHEWAKSHCPNGQTNCPNGQKKLPKWANQNAQTGSPIPDTLSDSISDVSFSNEKGFREIERENIGDVAAEFEAFGEPAPLKAEKKKSPPKLREAPPAAKEPTETYTFYEAWAQFVESKGIAVSKSKTGNSYAFAPKDGSAIKKWREWCAGLPNASGSLDDWQVFLQASWEHGGKWYQANFTPCILNSKRQELMAAFARYKAKNEPDMSMVGMSIEEILKNI